VTTTPDIRPAPISIASQVEAIVAQSKPDSTVIFGAVIDRDGWRTAILVRPFDGKFEDVSFGGYVDRKSDKTIEKPLSYGAFIRAEF
jgi:hypothetical protein